MWSDVQELCGFLIIASHTHYETHCHYYLFTVDQAHQALTAADVIADVTVGQPVNHVTIVHHVSGEK